MIILPVRCGTPLNQTESYFIWVFADGQVNGFLFLPIFSCGSLTDWFFIIFIELLYWILCICIGLVHSYYNMWILYIQVSKVHDKMLINHDKSFLLCKRIADADVKNQNIYVYLYFCLEIVSQRAVLRLRFQVISMHESFYNKNKFLLKNKTW